MRSTHHNTQVFTPFGGAFVSERRDRPTDRKPASKGAMLIGALLVAATAATGTAAGHRAAGQARYAAPTQALTPYIATLPDVVGFHEVLY